MLDAEVLQRISKEVGASPARVESTLKLLEEGATVPFIARYRKEVTGNLDEVKIRDIDEKRQYYKELDERRETILGTIEKQGQLTDELKQKILTTFTKSGLEDIYLPFKPKRKSKARLAIERGLQPLAEYIWEQTGAEDVEARAQEFVNLEKNVNSLDEAIEGALHILAERVAENPEFRNRLRDKLSGHGMVRATVVKGKESEKTKYEMYYKFEETRSEDSISPRTCHSPRDPRKRSDLHDRHREEKLVDGIAAQVIKERSSIFATHLERAMRDGFETAARAFHSERIEIGAARSCRGGGDQGFRGKPENAVTGAAGRPDRRDWHGSRDAHRLQNCDRR